MQTTIKQVNSVEYELEIDASADELAPELDKSLRSQRARTVLKGFRPGKVPLSLVKKMYGEALAFSIAEKSIQETYEAQVLKDSEHEVLGQPNLTKLDYRMGGDLHATIRFGVRPSFDLADLSGESISTLAHEVDDEEVEEEIRHMRKRHADLVASEDGAAAEDEVTVDMQRLDPKTGTPLIGEREEGVTFSLDDERLLDVLRDAILTRKAGEVFRVHLPGADDEEDDVSSSLLVLPGREAKARDAGPVPYEVTIKEVKRYDLPAFDAEFFEHVTGKDDLEDEAAFRAHVREQMEGAWKRQTRELLESNIVRRVLKLHPFPVPPSVVDVYLDSFVEDVKRRNDGELPEGFNEERFRAVNRDDAEEQARWMLIRDKIVKEAGLEVTEADYDAHFAEMGSGADTEMMARYYRQIPGLMEQLDQRLMSNKVFDWLIERFEVVEKDREAYEAEMEARREEEASAGPPAESTAPAVPDASSDAPADAPAEAEVDTSAEADADADAGVPEEGPKAEG